MGCRTRVIGNHYDPENEVVNGRGNLSFTSINLPRLGLRPEATLGVSTIYWIKRWIWLWINCCIALKFSVAKKHTTIHSLWDKAYRFVGKPQTRGQRGGSFEKRYAKHRIYRLGGDTEGTHWQTPPGSQESQKLGLEIIAHMRQRMEDESDRTGLNFSLLATPAEGLSGRFVKIDGCAMAIFQASPMGITTPTASMFQYIIPFEAAEDFLGGSLSCLDQCRPY